jgi:hypothetical protein
VALPEDPKIPTGAAAPLNPQREVFHPPPPGQLPAWLPWLGNLDQRPSDLENVTNANVALAKAASGKVLAERSKGKIRKTEILFPMAVVLCRIDIDGLLRASVVLEVCLAITLEVI